MTLWSETKWTIICARGCPVDTLEFDNGFLMDGRKFKYAEHADSRSIALLRDPTERQRPVTFIIAIISKPCDEGILRYGCQNWEVYISSGALFLRETSKAGKEKKKSEVHVRIKLGLQPSPQDKAFDSCCTCSVIYGQRARQGRYP